MEWGGGQCARGEVGGGGDSQRSSAQGINDVFGTKSPRGGEGIYSVFSTRRESRPRWEIKRDLREQEVTGGREGGGGGGGGQGGGEVSQQSSTREGNHGRGGKLKKSSTAGHGWVGRGDSQQSPAREGNHGRGGKLKKSSTAGGHGMCVCVCVCWGGGELLTAVFSARMESREEHQRGLGTEDHGDILGSP